MKTYEYKLVEGLLDYGGRDMTQNYVTEEVLNEYGKDGWSVSYSFNNGKGVMMQREIIEKQ